MIVCRSAAVLAFALSLSPFVSTEAQACACCSEVGQRTELTGTFDSYARDELASVRFAGISRLYSDAGFPDTMSGVKDPQLEDYKFNLIKRPKEWIFEFTDKNGQTGSVLFPLPNKFTRFEVDPHGLAAPAGGNGPDLYKEWRLHGISKLAGILSQDGVWAQARLIVHGAGNSCTSAPNFESWTLSIVGKNIKFRFLGTMIR